MAFFNNLEALQSAIAKFMSIHNNPHDTSKFNDLASKLSKLNPAISSAVPPVAIKDIEASVGRGGVNNFTDVKIVQTLLKIAVDGDCGPKTIAAIKTFQASLGFQKPDGRVDAGGKTWQNLKGKATPVVDPSPKVDPTPVQEDNEDQIVEEKPILVTIKDITASVGAGGVNKPDDTTIVQTLLKIDVDGDCGPKTIAAIKAFQASLGFQKPDGRVDAGGKTWQSLKGKATPVVDPSPKVDPSPSVDPKPVQEENTGEQGTTENSKNIPSVPSDLQANAVIKKSVGKGGDNDPADVLTVQKLLKETWGYDNPVDGIVDDKTIQAIRKFQYRFVGSIYSQDSKIDVGGNTWKYLIGELKPTMGKTDDGIIGGAETELEKKMAEFTKAFTGIQIEVSPGEFVSVRPPYHINKGHRLEKALKARKANSKVSAIISKLGYGGSLGKATPAQIEKFLEDCIAQNLIKDKSSQGLHDFLALYGVSTDCSGLAIQAANFLVQGDMERSTSGQDDEAVKITNTGGIQQHPKVSAPNKLRAGDMMVNYLLGGTNTYHVRIIVDVDVEEDAIAFTTVESGSATDLGDGGHGVGQRRWKFPNGTKFEKIQILKGNNWSLAGKSDQSYTYVRMRQLADI